MHKINFILVISADGGHTTRFVKCIAGKPSTHAAIATAPAIVGQSVLSSAANAALLAMNGVNSFYPKEFMRLQQPWWAFL